MTVHGMHQRSPPLLLASLLLLAALSLPAAPVDAAGTTYTVTSLGDTGAGSGLTGDLRFALTQANAGAGGDTIAFAVTGTITLTRALPVITKSVTIAGPGADRLTVNGNHLTRVLAINAIASGALTIGVSGLTITGGRDTGSGFNVGGGGIGTSFGVRLTLTDCVVADNVTAAGGGGGISIGVDSILTLERTVIRGNTAGTGGGIFNLQGSVRVHASTIAENLAGDGGDGSGGGIWSTGFVTLIDSTISGNTAGRDANGQGGGVIIRSIHAGLQVINSTISGNTAWGVHGGGQGGGIYTSQPALIVNSSVTGNTAGMGGAGGQGGGLYTSTIASSIRTELTNSTVARNSASGAGGGIADNFIGAGNTIVAGNTAPTAPDLSGTLSSQGHNLIGDPLGATGIDPTDRTGVDPLLGPLGDNGGPTQTLPLLPASPAIDAGGATCPASYFDVVTGTTVTLATDQRGVERPQGPACDIGAFEVRFTGSPLTLAPTALPDGTPGLPYAATFTASGGSGTSYTFAVTAGALPPGLVLSAAGVLLGTPTRKGTYRFTVTARDGAGTTGSREYTVVIGPAIPLPVRAAG